MFFEAIEGLNNGRQSVPGKESCVSSLLCRGHLEVELSNKLNAGQSLL